MKLSLSNLKLELAKYNSMLEVCKEDLNTRNYILKEIERINNDIKFFEEKKRKRK